MNKKAVVIISGGMDSTVMLHDVIKQGYEIIGALSFNYGQKHAKELGFALKTCLRLGIDHSIVDLKNLQVLLASALTTDKPIPEGFYEGENMKQTVVPSRNTIMLSIASGYAVSKGAGIVFYGAHAGDHTIYPDCRPEYIKKLNACLKIANFEPVKVIAPYQDLTKVEIIKKGLELGVRFRDTWTCYKGGEVSCGKCGSCQERLAAFKANGIEDPSEYISRELISK